MDEEKIQKALEKFIKNPYWKGIYEGAPEKAKEYYRYIFAGSLEEGTDAVRSEALVKCYKEMGDDDWDYIIGHEEDRMGRWGLKQAREKYQKKS